MMIEEDFCLHKLVLRDIRPTAIRVLVLRTLLEMKQAMSVSDLEAQLDTVDKSTIFRTLTSIPVPPSDSWGGRWKRYVKICSMRR